jgi:hypothetical protein
MRSVVIGLDSSVLGGLLDGGDGVGETEVGKDGSPVDVGSVLGEDSAQAASRTTSRTIPRRGTRRSRRVQAPLMTPTLETTSSRRNSL